MAVSHVTGTTFEFRGTIGNTVAESTPWWPAPRAPAAGSPNVVMLVLDDVGFSDFGCYGSEIRTPHVDALADHGLRYTNFHSTAICSASRACLLSGRNHHAVGMGAVANWDTGFPGYRGRVANAAGLMSEILRDAGYATFAVGKWHLTPLDETTAAGPYDQWPLQRGFDRFYGVFVGGNEWAPEHLIYDNHRVDAPCSGGYHFSEDIVDHGNRFVMDHMSIWPERPFFLYVCFHACHSPLHAPRALIDGYRGVFDDGWDECRQRRFIRQCAMGVVPPGTELAPRNPGVPAWRDLEPRERQLCVRLQEAYAGMLEHADAQIGRLIACLDEVGARQHTLVLLMSDNGGTQEGGTLGSPNWHRQQNRLPELSVQDALAALDDIGGPHSYPVYPAGWGQVSNTPLKRYKSQTHGGGVRVPLIASWPDRLDGPGGFRTQFHHLVDVLPTVLEATDVDVRSTIGGVDQLPIDGTSMLYSFASPAAPTPKRHQYFEMFGSRGIWAAGWKAVTFHPRGRDFDDDPWELYNLDHDFSECRDLSTAEPERLASLVELWWHEARRNDVLPLDDRGLERYRVPKPRPITDRHRFVYFAGTYVPTEGMPNIRGVSYQIAAHIHRPSDGDDGVLVACGDRTIGYALYIKNGRAVHDYNCAGEHSVVMSHCVVPTGECTIRYAFERVGESGGVGRLFLGDREVGDVHIPRTIDASFASVGLLIGANAGTSVSPAYDSPFPFRGTIRKVVYELAR